MMTFAVVAFVSLASEYFEVQGQGVKNDWAAEDAKD